MEAELINKWYENKETFRNISKGFIDDEIDRIDVRRDIKNNLLKLLVLDKSDIFVDICNYVFNIFPSGVNDDECSGHYGVYPEIEEDIYDYYNENKEENLYLVPSTNNKYIIAFISDETIDKCYNDIKYKTNKIYEKTQVIDEDIMTQIKNIVLKEYMILAFKIVTDCNYITSMYKLHTKNTDELAHDGGEKNIM